MLAVLPHLTQLFALNQTLFMSCFGLIRVDWELALRPAPHPAAASELDLPPCTREDRWVTLSSVERLVYERSKRAFVDAAFQLAQHGAAAGRGRLGTAAGRLAGRAMSALTALRQSCCHPQIVRRTDDTMGKERLSMREIMNKLVMQVGGGAGIRGLTGVGGWKAGGRDLPWERSAG